MAVTEQVRTAERAAGRPVRPRRHRDRPASHSRAVRWLLPTLLILLWIGLSGVLGPIGGKVTGIEQNDAAAYLPRSAEATAVLGLSARFEQQTLPAVVVYTRADRGALTPADRAAVQRDAASVGQRLAGRLAGPPAGPELSADGRAAQVVVPFAGTDIYKLAPYVTELRDMLGPAGVLTAHVTGPAGVQADLNDAMGAVDLVLVLVTALVIVVILIAVYRSPLLPFLVIGVAGVGLMLTQAVSYLLARHGLITVSAQTQGIVQVLVLGVATDYAMLLVSRYREELRRHPSRFDAIRIAWRASVGPILASAGTVALGMICLLVSDLASNRGLGPVAAIGVVSALAVMLTLMPAVLAILGRAAFWPFRPRYGSAPAEQRGIWARLARRVDRRPRATWVGVVVVLGVCCLGLLRLEAHGTPESQLLIKTDVDSKLGQSELAAHFPAGSGNPATIVARADRLGAVAAAARGVSGVDAATPFTGQPPAAGGAQPTPPKTVDGVARVDVTLSDAPDSDAAMATVTRLRAAVHAVPGADAQVGGYTAIQLDTQRTAVRDRNLVLPLVLGVVLVVLALLLRALVAPLMLIATVVLSFCAALGVSGLVFRDLFHFPSADASFPVYAFVFLVALGVDYNIFLMTRVREETARVGTRRGTLVALTVTGGVITSAGLVLAATFSALSMIPLVIMVELAFTVAFGVLLDTFVVRSLLVPALTIDLHRWVWWPSRLGRSLPTRPSGTDVLGGPSRVDVPAAAGSREG
jgi:putative drug exporter of the RND superfamily